jgi:hypothetical protein
MPDLGLTHVALTAHDLDASIAFYEKYARMAVVHRRAREGVRSVWLTDHTRCHRAGRGRGPAGSPARSVRTSRRRLREPGGNRSVICRSLPRGPADTRSGRCRLPRRLYHANSRPRRPFARTLFWPGSGARRAGGGEGMMSRGLAGG